MINRSVALQVASRQSDVLQFHFVSDHFTAAAQKMLSSAEAATLSLSDLFFLGELQTLNEKRRTRNEGSGALLWPVASAIMAAL